MQQLRGGASLQAFNLQESLHVGVPVESGFLAVKISNIRYRFEDTAHPILARYYKIIRVGLFVNFLEIISRVLTAVVVLQQGCA